MRGTPDPSNRPLPGTRRSRSDGGLSRRRPVGAPGVRHARGWAVGTMALLLSGLCLTGLGASASARIPGECEAAGEIGASASTPATTSRPSKRPRTKRRKAKERSQTRAKKSSAQETIKLQAVPATVGVNFGAGRTKQERVFKLTSTTPLKRSLVAQLVPVADPILRVGDTTASAAFPEPTFSTMALSRDRKTVRFRVCLNPASGLEAGKYTGIINIDGPVQVASDTMTVTANAKDGVVFLVALVVGLLLTAVVLLYKSLVDAVADDVAQAEALPETTPEERAVRKAAIKQARKLHPVLGETLLDLRWVIPTGAALAAAFGTVWAVYDANPAWGEAGPVSSVIAVLGAMLAAIGAKTIFSGGR